MNDEMMEAIDRWHESLDTVTVTLVHFDGTTKTETFRVDLDAAESGSQIMWHALRLAKQLQCLQGVTPKSRPVLAKGGTGKTIIRLFVCFDRFTDDATTLEFSELQALREYLLDGDGSVEHWQWDDDTSGITHDVAVRSRA